MSAKKIIKEVPATAGKGKKKCPNCDATMAARSMTCPACKFEIQPKDNKKKDPKPSESGAIDETAFIKVMIGKGWKYLRLVNEFSGEVVKEEIPHAIAALDLQFSPMPRNASGIHVVATSPQIQVSMSLDKFLEIARLKP